MRHITLLLIFISSLAFGQTKVPFAFSSPVQPNFYAYTNNGLWTDSSIRFTRYKQLSDTVILAIDANGYGYRITKSQIQGWAVASPIPSLQQVSNVGNSTVDTIFATSFETLSDSVETQKYMIKAADTAAGKFGLWLNSFRIPDRQTRRNEVLSVGYNYYSYNDVPWRDYKPNEGYNVTKYENMYMPFPGAGYYWFEHHHEVALTDGTIYRPMSWEGGKSARYGVFSYRADTWNYYKASSDDSIVLKFGVNGAFQSNAYDLSSPYWTFTNVPGGNYVRMNVGATNTIFTSNGSLEFNKPVIVSGSSVTLNPLAGSGTRWVVANSSGVLSTQTITNDWMLGGNSAPSGTFSHLGTTNNSSLRLISNNTERIIVDSTGQIGVGLAPGCLFDMIQNSSGVARFRLKNTNSGSSAFTGVNLVNDADVVAAFFLNSTNNTSSYLGANSFNMVNAGNYPLGLGTNNIIRLAIAAGGNIGVGVNSPTSVLHLKAGTTTANTAPLKFTAGSNVTIPENGAVEYDGTHYYGTAGGVRIQLDNSSTSTNIYNTDGTLTGTRSLQGAGFDLSFLNMGNVNMVATINPTSSISMTATAQINLSADSISLSNKNHTDNNDYRILVRNMGTGYVETIASDTNVISSAGTFTLSTRGYYSFSGTTTTWTLPTVGSATRKQYFIKNRGSGNITLNSNGGGNDIYNTIPASSLVILPGEAYLLYNDGTYFNVK